jgi:hypothetical protein
MALYMCEGMRILSKLELRPTLRGRSRELNVLFVLEFIVARDDIISTSI